MPYVAGFTAASPLALSMGTASSTGQQQLLSAVDAARKAARGAANLLLSGESGVGKEVLAQAIRNGSARDSQPFIAINCAALPHDLIESELFGMRPEASPARRARDARASSNRPMARRFFWTKYRNCLSTSRQSCLESCSNAKSPG